MLCLIMLEEREFAFSRRYKNDGNILRWMDGRFVCLQEEFKMFNALAVALIALAFCFYYSFRRYRVF
jgi:hypothetical protein